MPPSIEEWLDGKPTTSVCDGGKGPTLSKLLSILVKIFVEIIIEVILNIELNNKKI